MIDCNYIVDLLPYYINRTLSKEENSIVIQHLAKCKKCQKDITILILVKKETEVLFSNFPNEITKTAFKKVEDNKTNIILTLSQSLSMLKSVANLTRKAAKFAFQLI